VPPQVEVVLDVVDADAMLRFWSDALGYRPFGRWEQYRSLVDPDGRRPKLILQQVPEARQAKNRMHLDLHVSDVLSEVDRLAGIGATRIDTTPIAEAGTLWVRMADPEGNEFCVVRLEPSTREEL